MLSIINDLPPNVVGVTATGEVDKQDFETVLMPALDELQKRTGKINYLLLLETTVGNFTVGAWFNDLVLGMKHFTHWNRIDIVTNQKMVEKFSDAFSILVPGESKGFSIDELEEAKRWVSAS